MAQPIRARSLGAGRLILAIETCCDETCAAVITPRGEIHANVISSQAVHDRYGGVVPEIASRHHLELIGAVVEEALARAGVTLDEIELVAVTRARADRRAARRRRSAKALAAARRAAAGAGRPPPRPRRGELPRTGPFEPPFLCLIVSGGHTLLARCGGAAGRYRPLGTDARRRRRRGVRQGRAAARARVPGRAALERLAADGDRRLRVPDRAPGARARLLVRRAEDRRCCTGSGSWASQTARRRADLAASYQRAIVEALLLRVDRALAQTG